MLDVPSIKRHRRWSSRRAQMCSGSAREPKTRVAPRWLALACWVVSLGPARTHALESLEEFLQAARTRAFDAREASATHAQRRAELRASRLRLVPTLSATGRQIYNQKESIATIETDADTRTAVFVPHNQHDLVAQARMPLFDLPSFRQIGVAKNLSRAAAAREDAVAIDVGRMTAEQYYRAVATEALHVATLRSLEASERNLEIVRARVAAGVASELDERRAQSELERNRHILAEAEYQRTVARRALETLTGKTPSPGAPRLAVRLDPELPLSTFIDEGRESLPAVVAAHSDVAAARGRALAARGVLLPSVEGLATQTFTNAYGFGYKRFYSLGVSATFRFDTSAFASLAAEKRRAEAAQVQAERTTREMLDAIYAAWYDVHRQIEKSRASRAATEAASVATKIARERYQAGTTAFLEVVQAERDELNAVASAIDADANLCTARATLRLLSARPLDLQLCGVVP